MKISKLILPTALAATAAAPISMVACSERTYSLKIRNESSPLIEVTRAPKALKKKEKFIIKGTSKLDEVNFGFHVYCKKKDVTEEATLVWSTSGDHWSWSILVKSETVCGNMIVTLAIKVS